MLGYLDEVTTRSIRGWAGRTIELVASVNGEQLGRFRPTMPRPDLAGMDGKALGFEVDFDYRFAIGDVVVVTNANGEHLNGSPLRISKLRASKEEKALWCISRDMTTLEIGPSYNPIAPRSRGWRSFSLDHMTKQELQHKYRDLQQAEQIENVDFVWKSGAMESAIPAEYHGTFDAVLASHVIEHFPNPLAFFHSAAVLLKPTGLISLVVPDKRFMFDFFRPLSQTSDYLYARYLRRTRHSKRTAFDNLATYVTEGGTITWSAQLLSNFAFNSTLSDAQAVFDSLSEDETGEYVDFHATVYTPSSFELIMLELGQLGHLPFAIEHQFPTCGCEFFVTLCKCQPEILAVADLDRERLRLMKAVVRELGEQARFLHDHEESLTDWLAPAERRNRLQTRAQGEGLPDRDSVEGTLAVTFAERHTV